MKVGFSKVDITPNVGVPLAGYLKRRISKGIHSSLYARTLVIKSEQKLYLWVSLDLIAIDDNFMRLLKKELVAHHFQDIEVFATHTHAGPEGTIESGAFKGVFGEFNQMYLQHVVICCIHAIKEACLDLSKATLSIAQGNCSSVGSSRHSADIPIPNTLTTMVWTRDKKADILLYHFACHPTILHDDNVEISSDFVGEVEKQLANEYPNVMFLNGSCGNISTRFTRQEPTKNEVVRLASMLTKCIKETLLHVKVFDLSRYQAFHFSYTMEKKKLGSKDAAKQLMIKAKQNLEKAIKNEEKTTTIRLLQSLCEGANVNNLLVERDDGSRSHKIHLSIIKLNEWIVICMPAELFSTLEEQIEYKKCIVINYANGYHAYFADKDAYEQGYYEAHMSYYKKGEGEKLIDYINEKIKEIYKMDKNIV